MEKHEVKSGRGKLSKQFNHVRAAAQLQQCKNVGVALSEATLKYKFKHVHQNSGAASSNKVLMSREISRQYKVVKQ